MRVDTRIRVTAYIDGVLIAEFTEVFSYLTNAKTYAATIKKLNPGMTVKLEKIW